MKLAQTYANNASIDTIQKSYLYEKYFPLPINKYITLQNSSGMGAKNFSYWQEVVDILFPILEQHKIKIVLLGDKDSQPLNKVINLNGQTTLHQSAYIVKRALLHAGNDSWICHYAGANNIPLVALYGSTTVHNHAPYYFDKDKSIFLESHRNGQRASFQRDENPKMIDLINPEDVCAAICKLLGLEFTYPFKTLKIGAAYINKIIESAMDSVINIQALGIPHIICRMDYNFNLQNLTSQATVGKVSILTDRIIPTRVLLQLRHNIIEVIYELKEDNSPSFCQTLQDLQIPYRLFSKLSDDKLNSIKLDYIDYNIIGKSNNDAPSILAGKSIEKIFIKGGKFIIGQRGIFPSYWSYKNSTPISNLDAPPQPLVDINIEDLRHDQDYIMFLEKT